MTDAELPAFLHTVDAEDTLLDPAMYASPIHHHCARSVM
jgi:hypothetical protein